MPHSRRIKVKCNVKIIKIEKNQPSPSPEIFPGFVKKKQLAQKQFKTLVTIFNLIWNSRNYLPTNRKKSKLYPCFESIERSRPDQFIQNCSPHNNDGKNTRRSDPNIPKLVP